MTRGRPYPVVVRRGYDGPCLTDVDPPPDGPETSPPRVVYLPPDPAFTPKAFDRMARLLEVAVVVFLGLAVVGFVTRLAEDWGMSLPSVIHREPRSWYWTPESYFANLFAFNPSAVVLLGVAVRMAAVIGRSVISAMELWRAGEVTLGAITVSVLALIATAFVLARFA